MSLFHPKDFRYTQDAHTLDAEAHAALKPVMDKYFGKGYNPREVQYIVVSTALDLALERLLRP